MREAIEGERVTGWGDRGLLGGFAAALLRGLRANPAAFGSARRWAVAALTGYGLKDPSERDEVGRRLAPHLGPGPKGGGADLDAPVSTLPGVGGRVSERLAALGCRTLGDLLDHLPRDYIDRREVRRIADLRVGQQATVIGTVRNVTLTPALRRGGRARSRVVVTISDGSGYLDCVWWNQDWRARTLAEGTQAAFSGRVDMWRGRPQMSSPAYDLLGTSAEPLHTGRIVPVYPATERLSAAQLRRLLYTAFERIGRLPDPLPVSVRVEHSLMSKDVATRLIHFPETLEDKDEARRRHVFEELFLMQVGLALRRRHLEDDVRGIVHDPAAPLVGAFLDSLPFRLTGAQARTMEEIARDMASPRPMHRLLQGEVGSGKTIVAVYAAIVAVASGAQAAIMAPTEVLAEQHVRRIRELCEPVGVGVELLTSTVPAARRRDVVMRLGAGDLGIVCGTHALLSEDVAFARLGLVVVDEQHRFGLGQRVRLREKGENPDVLIMTATPIPRTLALTLYGDLDVSTIDELPAGRTPPATVVVTTPQGRAQAYEHIRREVLAGRRAFVVCALVDESDALAVRSATSEAERLRREVFPHLDVGLLHGQMRPGEKDAVMERFRRGEVGVLIATTVVEVGVDVPEATVMLVENAERFGLAQLHQLRGRVGRGGHAATCYLCSEAPSPEARARLEAVAASTDGLELAERDLELRGEGTIFGERQAGLTDLRVARLVRDLDLVVEARRTAFALVSSDPRLERPEHALLSAEVRRRFGNLLNWLSRA